MRRAKQNTQAIEVFRRSDVEDAKASLAKLVEQKVQEALSSGTSDDSIFEPFFQPRAIAQKMRQQQNVSQQQKWTLYYEKFGCLRSQTKAITHNAAGMCQHCHQQTLQRLKVCIRELDAERPMAIPTLDRTELAQRAIIETVKASPNPAQRRKR
jgi:hypothetical protein